ncbi:hypothetical protein A2678_01530 [Candidatus Kaiserbacteria bacterium RIFCSPHIGHO2_01_FULL_53_31]|uniref:Glycosyltransferase subfamily 4-like N-terminal domain-containing protein n=1 Tax=Candidatus Kaiserbacteria bacterium RIFCSPHIGHO2_01_FULL_53_31 TaxID=1798481 RepID=A0A1F6CGV9_9BACT|nr:MAG: hypothetical protein A2678_01530 [Candidatus Kaiserbacteria bacterium RIFCSPHIGHO2_01_FULL_53_31]
MSKIKVVIGEKNLNIGGTQRLAIDQLTLLDKSIFDVYLITLSHVSFQGDFYDLVPPGVAVHRLDFKNWHDISEWSKLIALFRRIRPDIVKSSGFFGNAIFRTLQPFFGFRAIAAEYGTVPKRSVLHRLINKILDRVTYTTIGDSKKVVAALADSAGYSPEKLTVIYNGVDLAAIEKSQCVYGPERESIRREFGIGTSDVVFLCIARFIYQKNHSLMIDAFAEAARSRADFRLVLVGDGALREPTLRHAEELSVQNRVIMVGERKDLHRFYSMSDFFLMTSRYEGFSIVSMEGMAFGLPLLSTRVAGICEYLADGNNGFFLEPEPHDIAEKMLKIAALSKEELYSMKERAKRTADGFSLERYANACNQLFIKAAQHTS